MVQIIYICVFYMEHTDKLEIKNTILKQLRDKIPLSEEEQLLLMTQIIELKQWSVLYPKDRILKENIKLLQNYME